MLQHSEHYFTMLQIHLTTQEHFDSWKRIGKEYDNLHKIKPLLQLLFPNFERAYDLHKNISIQNCMIPWRGHLSFQQFTTSKPIRFGIKVWVLADSESKYICGQQLYIGRNPGESAEVGLATRVVKELGIGLEGNSHHLYTDDFYTSVDLYQYLFDNKIYACGTIKGSRKNFPKEIVFEGTRGTYQWQTCGPLLPVAWPDNKPIYFLTTNSPPWNFTASKCWDKACSAKRGRKGRGKWRCALPSTVGRLQ